MLPGPECGLCALELSAPDWPGLFELELRLEKFEYTAVDDMARELGLPSVKFARRGDGLGVMLARELGVW
jgi:hypothetical protein